MTYEDSHAIATPEGITLTFTLAGIGSRFVAIMVDTLLQLLVTFALGLAVWTIGGLGISSVTSSSTGFVVAVIIVVAFGIQFGYWVGFEVLSGGRTPGKRLVGIRVIGTEGQAVAFRASALRTLVRLVDWLPSFYLVGIITVVLTASNQRLGDLAAATLVVRDRKPNASPFQSDVSLTAEDLQAWDVSALTNSDIAVVEEFLQRRATLSQPARGDLAEKIASQLSARVVAPLAQMEPESFLEQLVSVKHARR